jgi:hypothetical protein
VRWRANRLFDDAHLAHDAVADNPAPVPAEELRPHAQPWLHREGFLGRPRQPQPCRALARVSGSAADADLPARPQLARELLRDVKRLELAWRDLLEGRHDEVADLVPLRLSSILLAENGRALPRALNRIPQLLAPENLVENRQDLFPLRAGNRRI